MFEEFRRALWFESHFNLSGYMDKHRFVRGLTVVMVDGEPDGFEDSIPLIAVLPGLR